MHIIGHGLLPDEPRVVARWEFASLTGSETPLRIQHGGIRGTLPPNTDTIMPACVANTLVEDCGYNVVIVRALDDDQAGVADLIGELDASAARATEIIKLPVAKLAEAIVDLDLATLHHILEAEQAEGPGKTRKGAVEILEAAIIAATE